jgi:hypothetical protein
MLIEITPAQGPDGAVVLVLIGTADRECRHVFPAVAVPDLARDLLAAAQVAMDLV